MTPATDVGWRLEDGDKAEAHIEDYMYYKADVEAELKTLHTSTELLNDEIRILRRMLEIEGYEKGLIDEVVEQERRVGGEG